MAFYNEDISTIFKKLNSSENGISQTTVETRQTKYGKNVLDKQKKPSFFKKLLYQFTCIELNLN